ncbi:hypothetical protein GQ53DRAFT_763046 [Thozetella sp. PMI_491]|nr:hypothetical protein GQ53DRAFT_763046 [Thozetella sp. PMI_491]
MQSGTRSKPTGFHFINSARPGDATDPDTLSEIRSHAAKEIRARARRSRAAASRPDERASSRLGRPAPDACADVAHLENSASTRPVLITIPRSLGIDLYWSSALPLSDDEMFLIHHYMSYIVPFGMVSCQETAPEVTTRLIALQLEFWLPFALADADLTAALLLHACRSLGELGVSPRYAGMGDTYEQRCIQAIHASVSREHTRASDATIAMVMVLLADQYMLGNFDHWGVHFDAFAKMITMRGGVDALGVGGFLKEIIVK